MSYTSAKSLPSGLAHCFSWPKSGCDEFPEWLLKLRATWDFLRFCLIPLRLLLYWWLFGKRNTAKANFQSGFAFHRAKPREAPILILPAPRNWSELNWTSLLAISWQIESNDLSLPYVHAWCVAVQPRQGLRTGVPLRAKMRNGNRLNFMAQRGAFCEMVN
jgi:hypothetical protein